MEFGLVILLCFWAAVANAKVEEEELKLEADEPFQRVAVDHKATVRCCYRWKESPGVIWIMNVQTINGTTLPRLVNQSENVTPMPMDETNGVKCHSLVFKSLQLNDTGLYQCKLNLGSLHAFTHGTFLQAYKPLQKTLDLSESVKNSIITAEGVLLLLCVLVPGTMLLCKSKTLNELNKKKGREEENIYEGLNLDDCNSAYHQIQRSNQQGPYQDVAICGEDIQLEKP
ncbi:B-cell antigen receptor complex-associated protein alpha chain [Rhinichthys klamathensis goyatoka]|uniref:B-cell antigen receptor complex-associated protein alpha chain n=1 Tax=Rhinichthys klamathensis goyatoka TaxID=3034132 RepID=UPI0024B55880|nr:B-cell antigen receptor complex-associated protein alpha chain [Rhinichthys klamathensis goyatoka]